MNPLPYPSWRKKAERGYMVALGLTRPSKNGSREHQCAVFAILALLDAQDGPKHTRLFRGWFFDLSKSYDENLFGRTGQQHDRLIRDNESDVRFLLSATESAEKAAAIFRVLYYFIEARGEDTRPLWRRSGGPWPKLAREGDDGLLARDHELAR